MDGLTAVVEHLDLRGEEAEQWREPACPDYLDIRQEFQHYDSLDTVF
jgi:hypothetical protein